MTDIDPARIIGLYEAFSRRAALLRRPLVS